MITALTDQASPWITFQRTGLRVLYCFSRDCRKLLLAVFVACAMTTGLATAQTRQAMPTIGVLWISDASRAAQYLLPFKERLRELGWIDGRTVRIVERYDNGDASRLPALAAELVALNVDILYVSAASVPAAMHATNKIPIICPSFYDPIAEGVTHSMARPDRNITGVSWQTVETAAKRLQFAQELIPDLRRVAVLFDPRDPGSTLEASALFAAVRTSGIDLKKVEVRAPRDFQTAFAKLRVERPDALLVIPNLLTLEARDMIVGFASRIRLPVISELPDFAVAGAVLTYGPNILEVYRRGAYFVDRILKGAKPADLPFEQPTRFQLVVNLKTAKALGLTIPESITVSATSVIR